MKKIEIDNVVLKNDYRKLVYFNSVGKVKWKRNTLIALVVFCLLYLLYSVGIKNGLDLISGFAGMYLVFLSTAILALERNINKLQKEEDCLIGKEQSITIRDNGLKVRNFIKPNGENYSWQNVLNVYSTKNYYYVYTSTGQIIVITKNTLDKNLRESLEDTFSKKLEGRFVAA